MGDKPKKDKPDKPKKPKKKMALATTSITTWNDNGSGTWLDPGAGGGSAQNLDVFFSNGGSRARKVSNGIKGFYYQVNAAGQDLSGEVVAVRWAVLAGVGALDTRTLGGVAVAVQDTSGNVSYWDVDGADTYGGGWKLSTVDMATSPSRNSGTAATLTAVQYVGILWDVTASVGGGDPNCYIDAIYSWPQAGVTVTGNSTSFIDDLVDDLDLDNAGTDGGYGIWERRSGIVYSKARLILAPDASDYSDTDRTLVFENPVYDAGSTIDSTNVELGIECGDTDTITFTRCSFIMADPDEAVTTDANREFDMTSASDANFDTCTIVGFDGTVMHLGGTGNSYDDCTFQRCSQIVDTGAVVRRGFVRDTAAAATEASLLWTTTSNWEDTQFVMGTANSHAMEIETNITDAWTGFTFTGYNATTGPTSVGNEVLINNANGGVVTINASAVTGTISFRNNGTSTTTINNNVTVTFDTMRDLTEVRIYAAGTSTELDGIENATAGSADNRNFPASVAGGTSVDYTLVNLEYEIIRVEGFTWPATNQTIPVQQRLDRNYDNP